MKLNELKPGDPLRCQGKVYKFWVASGDSEILTISLQTDKGYLRVKPNEVEVIK
jgi:hypothetical protein